VPGYCALFLFVLRIKPKFFFSSTRTLHSGPGEFGEAKLAVGLSAESLLKKKKNFGLILKQKERSSQ
jgi:hypothetical protein